MQHSGDRGGQLSEVKASLIYPVNSRTTRAAQRNPVSINTNKNKTKVIISGCGRRHEEDKRSSGKAE